MCWNMVAMSFTCMPSDAKLLRMSSGWCVNCCSCMRCFFRDETTSLIRAYWEKEGEINYEKHGKLLKAVDDRTLWAHQCVYFEASLAVKC